MSWLVRVSMPHACFGFIVGEDGVVIESAPIAKWATGRRGREVVRYFRSKSAVIEVLSDPEPTSTVTKT